MTSVWEIAGTGVAGVRSGPPESAEFDVAVIGAGITGLTVALRLVEAGQRVIVLEARRVGEGNTGHSTGNLYSTVAGGLTPLAHKWGEATTQAVVDARAQAVDAIEAAVERHAIDCAFERGPLHFVATEADGPHERWLVEEHQLASRLGIDAQLTDHAPLPLQTRTTLRLDRQAQFNPLSYVRGLAAAVIRQGGVIHEQSPVHHSDPDHGQVSLGDTRITAQHVVEATHTPKGISVLQTAMLPHTEHGISARMRGASSPRGAFWMLDTGHSIRGYRHDGADHLVVIGRKHKTGEETVGADHYERLREHARAHFDVAEFEHAWSAQQFTSADRLPWIGRGPGMKTSWVATGFGADGLVWGTVAGALIADLVLERDNPWSALFSPTRLTPAKSAREWIRENTSVATHFAQDRLNAEQIDRLGEIAPGAGRIASIDGEKVAVCRTGDGRLSVLSAQCPHMKCLMQWNASDGTWDCPCHGSRFQADGTVIEGPAYHGLTPRSPEEPGRPG